MKKYIYVLLAAALVLGLMGCGGSPSVDVPHAVPTEPVPVPTEPASDLPPREQVEQTIEEILADPQTAVPSRIQSALDGLYEQGLLEEQAVYSEEDELFTFVYDGGVRGGVSLKEMSDETDGAIRASGRKLDPILSAHTGEALNVLILNGFEDTQFRTDFYNGLYADWSNLGLNVTLDSDVSVSDLGQIQPYDLILFSMHGASYDDNPAMSLDEAVNSENDLKYDRYLRDEQSVAKVYCTDGKWHYWVMNEFFADSYDSGDLDGKVIYVQCCGFFGCRCYTDVPDTSFADTFLNLSAETVFGYYNSVNSVYGRNVMRTALEAMFEGETASEALRRAVEIHGQNDGSEDPSRDKYAAWPEIAGDPDMVLIQNRSSLGDGYYSVTLEKDSFYNQGGDLWSEVSMTGYVILSAGEEAALAPGSVISLSQYGLEDIHISKIVRYREDNFAELNDGEYLLQQYYGSDQWILTYPYNDLPVTYVAGVEQLPIASYAEVVDDTMLMQTPLDDPRDFFEGTMYFADSWPCTITVSDGQIVKILFEYRP